MHQRMFLSPTANLAVKSVMLQQSLQQRMDVAQSIMQINSIEFANVVGLAQKLIVKEFAQLPPYMTAVSDTPLEREIEKYGYAAYCMFSDEKAYVCVFRDFSKPRHLPLPQVPELQLRRQAEEYEEQRQKMGYVTEVEMELAKKCIESGTMRVDYTNPAFYLQGLRTIYGLFWLGYERNCGRGQHLQHCVGVLKCEDEEYRLKMLKQYRQLILKNEEKDRLKDLIAKKNPEPAHFVTDYLKVKAHRNEIKRNNEKGFFSGIVTYLKSLTSHSSKTTKYLQADEEEISLKEAPIGDQKMAYYEHTINKFERKELKKYK